MLKKTVRLAAVLTVVVCFAAGVVAAEESVNMDEWAFYVDLYGWLPNIKGESASGNDIDIEVGTILDDLNFTVMGGLGAQKGRWSFMADIMYFDMEDDQNGTVNLPLGHHVNTYIYVDMSAWVVTPMVGFNVLQNDRFRLGVLAGARYLYLSTDVKLDVGPAGRYFSDSDSIWDAIVGIRGEVMFNEKWFLPYHLDIGTGGSELTYQLFGGIGYRFTKVDLVAGYRYLRWNFDDSPVLDNMYISGPLVGIKFRF